MFLKTKYSLKIDILNFFLFLFCISGLHVWAKQGEEKDENNEECEGERMGAEEETTNEK